MRKGGTNFGKDRGSYLQWILNEFPDSDWWWKAAASDLTKLKQPKSAKLFNVGDLISELKDCTRKRDLPKGRGLHSNAVKAGIDSNIYVANALISLYAKCGSMKDARTVFDSIEEPNVVCWTVLILGHTDNGQGSAALDLFSRMKDEGRCAPDSVTYLAALKACMLLAADGGECGKRECLEKGRHIHSEIGHHIDLFSKSMLINLYGKCGSMKEARTVFDSIQEPDVVCWNAIILGYAENGQGFVALDLFSRMKIEGRCAANSSTYAAALKACTFLAADEGQAGEKKCLQRARHIHSAIGCHMDHVVQNTLINLYAKCGSMEDARAVYDTIQDPDVVSWTAIIMGYAENGQGSVALDLFFRMKDEGRCTPDSVIYLAVLKACTLLAADGGESAKIECLELGRQIHLEIGRHMNHSAQNALINLYAKCGSMNDARTVFDSMQVPDVVSWTAIIMGYADNGQGLAALDLFSRMKVEGRCAPNLVAYLAALKACCSIGALAIGRRIHSGISQFNSHVVTCLVDFYAKCGNMAEAREVFDLHAQLRIVSTWNAALAGYARVGDTSSVFSLFDAMQDQGFQPDAVTFVCILSCCSHAGLIEKARNYLELMPVRYKLTPTLMHYNCMIDLLGRANKLDEAVALLQKMPFDPNAVTWTALLGACRKWKNAKIGRWAFESLMDLDSKNASAYVFMADIYGNREQEKMLETRRKFGACKLPGQAYVMDGLGRMAKFADAQETEKQILQSMKEQAGIAVHNVQENVLCGHSGRRAVFYGLLNTPPGEVIRVVKNIRMCNDCHFSTKMVSKIAVRVVMIRDGSRFHVMENGNCSCKDYF